MMTENKIGRWLFNGIIQNFLPGLMIILFLLGGNWSGKNHQDDRVSAPAQPLSTNRVIRVEIIGAVINPGIYELDVDSRVYEAIAAAGGIKPDAESGGVNLAEHLYDGQRLEIPYPGPDKLQPPTGTPVRPGNEVINSMPPGADEEKDANTLLPTSTPFDDTCAEPATGGGVFAWPVQARFLSGNDFSPTHPGIDLAAGMGSPVYAADSGMIRLAGYATGYGNLIEIDHGNGYSTVYAHLSVIDVKVCRNVYAGQRIGLAGNTGNANGAHLHFEVLQDGGHIDPWSIFPEP